ncbi:MAG: Na/Pi cotransporter family protein [Bacteroidetes bacterium]|nr:Na/Pi cotransporter family protein [Bacteroidota bacterium]
MNSEFSNILFLLGSLAFLVFGMKMMTEAIQKVLGDSLRRIIESSTENKFKGIFNGFFTTALIQSSSATIVVAVSLVNVGILTLIESGSVILGANIGTTVSSWMIAVLGFKMQFNMSAAVPLIAVGVPFLFAKKRKVKFIGEIIIGFAIVFTGLEFLMHAVSHPNLLEIYSFLQDNNDSIFSCTFIVLIGALFSFALQSTAVAIALTQTLAFTGIIPIETALELVLGHNLGSIINTEITALAGNVHAKRAARIHSVFNVVSVIWASLFLTFIIPKINFISENILGTGSIYSAFGAPIGIAIFHTTYNAINVLIMMWFIPYLAQIATKTVKSKGGMDEEYHLEFIDSGLMTSPEISVSEAKKELVKFAQLTKAMNDTFRHLLKEQENDAFENLVTQMRKYEDLTDNFDEEITNFLTKVSQGELTEENSFEIRRLLSIVGDLEQIGDIFYGMALIMERKKESKVWFIQEQRDHLNVLLDKLDKAFDAMIKNLSTEYVEVSLSEAREIENEIDSLRDNAQNQHLESMEKGDYSYRSGMYYKDLFSNCERIGDYIIKVSEAVTGKH